MDYRKYDDELVLDCDASYRSARKDEYGDDAGLRRHSAFPLRQGYEGQALRSSQRRISIRLYATTKDEVFAQRPKDERSESLVVV